jgi:hypothetical protein
MSSNKTAFALLSLHYLQRLEGNEKDEDGKGGVDQELDNLIGERHRMKVKAKDQTAHHD